MWRCRGGDLGRVREQIREWSSILVDICNIWHHWCWSPLQIIVRPQRWCTICHCLTWYQISSQKLPFPLSSCHLEDTVLIKILSAPLALVFLYLCLWLKKLLTSDKETKHVREGGPSGFGESGQAIKINQIVTVRDAKSVMNIVPKKSEWLIFF